MAVLTGRSLNRAVRFIVFFESFIKGNIKKLFTNSQNSQDQHPTGTRATCGLRPRDINRFVWQKAFSVELAPLNGAHGILNPEIRFVHLGGRNSSWAINTAIKHFQGGKRQISVCKIITMADWRAAGCKAAIRQVSNLRCRSGVRMRPAPTILPDNLESRTLQPAR